MCSDGNWHCQNAFRDLYIFSPHKRRSEIEAKGKYRFEYRKCEHGVAGQRDYKMIKIEYYELPSDFGKEYKFEIDVKSNNVMGFMNKAKGIIDSYSTPKSEEQTKLKI